MTNLNLDNAEICRRIKIARRLRRAWLFWSTAKANARQILGKEGYEEIMWTIRYGGDE